MRSSPAAGENDFSPASRPFLPFRVIACLTFFLLSAIVPNLFAVCCFFVAKGERIQAFFLYFLSEEQRGVERGQCRGGWNPMGGRRERESC